ncbi:Protein of unknown function [Prevotellaceae bacterium HUN156]|nr:Protein of unknown function [Prevotellaceae bacterium HUN156]
MRVEHYDVMDNKQKRLVIRVSRSSLSFSVATDSDIVFEPYALNSSISMTANMREALRTTALLNEHFERVLVMVDSLTLMVPANLFSEEERDQMYHHAFTGQEQQVVMHTVLPDLNAVVLFSIQKDLRNVLNDNYNDVRYTAAIAPVWRHLHQRSYTGQHQKLYGYFHDRKMEVFSFAQNRFLFCNAFSVNNPNDALYYLLGVWKQLALSAEHDELHLVGDIMEREKLIEEAQRFIKRVFYINPSGEFNRAAVTQINGMPYDLMTLFVKGR